MRRFVGSVSNEHVFGLHFLIKFMTSAVDTAFRESMTDTVMGRSSISWTSVDMASISARILSIFLSKTSANSSHKVCESLWWGSIRESAPRRVLTIYSTIGCFHVSCGQKWFIEGALGKLYLITDHVTMFDVNLTMDLKTCTSPDQFIPISQPAHGTKFNSEPGIWLSFSRFLVAYWGQDV